MIARCFVFIGLFFVSLVWSSPPASVNLGGIFPTFTSDDEVDAAQAQYLAAFIMAVNEINDKSDGVADDLLPNTHINIAVRQANNYFDGVKTALELTTSTSLCNVSGVHAVVSAASDVATMAVYKILTSSQILQLQTRAMHSDFAVQSKYPYKVQTVPSSSFQGRIYQRILCSLGYSKVSLFASNDAGGTQATLELTDETYCKLSVMSSHSVPPTQTDFSADISRALAGKARIFVLFLQPAAASHLLSQGYDAGLFRMGRQILANEALLTPDIWASIDSQVTSVLKGLVLLKFWPEYSLKYTDAGADFRTRFAAQTNTIMPDGSCVNATDDSDDDVHYLYRNEDYSLCAGLDFSTFNSENDFDPFIAQTYDAVYTFAYGLHHLLYEQGESEVDGSLLREAIYTNVSFVGASGLVDISDDGVNAGRRFEGLHYRVMNFNAEQYLASPNTDAAFVTIAKWDSTDNLEPCDSAETVCFNGTYNTADNKLPSNLPPYTLSTLPSVLKIGGLFSPFTKSGAVNTAAAQQLAAFLMAIREINDKSDGVADDLLPNTQIVVTVHSSYGLLDCQLQSRDMALVDFGGTGVSGVVGGAADEDIFGAYNVFGITKTIMVHSVATHYLFDEQLLAPYRLQTTQSPATQGKIFQHILCHHYKYRKVTVFATNDFAAMHAAEHMMNGEFCDLQLLSMHAVTPLQEDFSAEIAEAKDVGARIFVILMDYPTAGPLLEQGYAAGLFGEGRQVFGTQEVTTANVWKKSMSEGADVAAILKGYIGICFLPNYSLGYTDAGKNFVQRWRAQEPTLGSEVDGEFQCDRTRDDNDGFSYYSSRLHGLPGDETCAGLNYSSFSEDGSDIAPYTSQTYDATYLLLRSIHTLLYQYGQSSVNATLLYGLMVNGPAFDGASGRVDLYEGLASNHYYGRGGRLVGMFYEVLNFNAELYHNSSGDEGFVGVGVWDLDEGLVMCRTPGHCGDIVYNSKNNKPVSDTPPPIVITLSPSIRYALIVVGCLLLVITLTFASFALAYRKKALIRASQPGMLYVMFLGAVLAAGRVLVAAMEINDVTCSVGLWLGHLGFALIFGSLLVKTWRIHRIVNNRTLTKIKITQADVLRILTVIMLILCVYMAFLTVFGKPHSTFFTEHDSNRETRYPRCSFGNAHFHSALFVAEALSLLYGVRLCWLTKDVPDAINESKYILATMTIIAIVCSLVFPVVFLIKLYPTTQQTIASFSIGVTVIACLLILFGNKCMMIYVGKTQKINITMVRNKHEKRSVSLSSNSRVTPSSGESSSSAHEDQPNAILAGSSAFPANMPYPEKVSLCRDQIATWTTMLMRISDPMRPNSETYSGHIVSLKEFPEVNASMIKEKSSATPPPVNNKITPVSGDFPFPESSTQSRGEPVSNIEEIV